MFNFPKTLKSKPGNPPHTNSQDPYASNKAIWNEYFAGLWRSRQFCQLAVLLSLITTLCAVAGMLHFASLPRLIPYLVQADAQGHLLSSASLKPFTKLESRYVHAALCQFISDVRLVSSDSILQEQAIDRAFAHIKSSGPCVTKLRAYLDSNSPSNPKIRKFKETVHVQILSAMPITERSWQVEWLENKHDLQGRELGSAIKMKATLSYFHQAEQQQNSEHKISYNPLGIFISDFNWSQVNEEHQPINY